MSVFCRRVLSVSHLVRPTLPLTIRRTLLNVPEAEGPRITVHEARRELVNIVGTSHIWGEERDPSVTSLSLPSSQNELPHKNMLDSYREACIPLGSAPHVRTRYCNFYGSVRVGKILEALDTMAVLIGYTHNTPEVTTDSQYKSSLSVVTAFVDNIVLKTDEIASNKDIVIRGHVTWVGKTSMEISLSVDQKSNASGFNNILDATFLMVARDPRNKGKAFVCPLNVETAEEKALFDLGEGNKLERSKQSKESLFKLPPNEDERKLIHNLFLNTIDPTASTFRQPKKPTEALWMEETKLKNIYICFPEQRNLYNKIFGGFLMRVAYELGWANATVHCKSRVYVVAMDDIMFQKPVEIGSLLYLSSQIVYTEGCELQTRVHAEVVNPKTGDRQTTNVFHFTFVTRDQVPVVIPKSYAEYMMYLDGKRHFTSNHLNVKNTEQS